MKKFITLLLVLTGMVSTASATYYVAGSSTITNQTSTGNWEAANSNNAMTQRADGKYQLVVTGKSLEKNTTYNYQITDGQWGSGHQFGWNGGNASFTTQAAGTYTITYVFDADNSDVYEAEALLTDYAENEGIFLHSNKTWEDNDSYKFTSDGTGTFTLDVDVSEYSVTFYYRFHYSGDNNDFGGYEGNVGLNNGYYTGYEMNLTGNFWKNYNNDGKDHNFFLPLATKPCAKLHLELQVVNKKVTMNMLCYEKATTNDKGFTTFVNYYPLTISGATAYYATDDNDGTATAHAITNPAASTPMLIKGDASTTYYFAVASDGTSYSSTNAFYAGTGTLNGTDGGGYNYILKGDAFYLANGNNVATNKAYLKLSAPANGRALKFFDNEETGINMVNGTDPTVNGYYGLQGCRVVQPTKGLYIVNGKKVMVK